MCLFLIHWKILKKEGKNTVSHLLVYRDEASFAASEGNNFLTSPLVRCGEACFPAAKLGPAFLFRSSEAIFTAARVSSSLQRRALFCCEVYLYNSEGTLRRSEATHIPTLINTRGCPFFFPSTHFLFVTLCLLLLSGVRFFFYRFLADHDYYGS